MVELPWAADSCPWVGKLRTVVPLTVGIRDGAVQLVLTHQRVRGGIFVGVNMFGLLLLLFQSCRRWEGDELAVLSVLLHPLALVPHPSGWGARVR